MTGPLVIAIKEDRVYPPHQILIWILKVISTLHWKWSKSEQEDTLQDFNTSAESIDHILSLSQPLISTWKSKWSEQAMDYGGKTYADSGTLTGTMREVQAVKGGIPGCSNQFHLSHNSSGWKEVFFLFK